jgi:hypothetical protein
MLSKLSLLARLAVIAVAIYLFLAETTGPVMVYWAVGAGICFATLFKLKRKTPKGEEVTMPKQIPTTDGRVAYAGKAKAFTTYFGGRDIDPESISMAAMRREDGYIVALDKQGGYDELVFVLFNMKLIREPGRHTTMNWEKGYLTSEGRFVSGKKVIKIAQLAGQLPNDTPMERLFSIRDLYPDEPTLARQAMAVVG